MKIAGLILAGGEGRRMGGADKALLSLGGRPLIRHVVERLSPQVEELAISGRTSHSGFGLPVLADAQIERFGPLAGVAAGLAWAAGIGAIWPIGRLWYALGYYSAPEKRVLGLLVSMPPIYILVLGALVGFVLKLV